MLFADCECRSPGKPALLLPCCPCHDQRKVVFSVESSGQISAGHLQRKFNTYLWQCDLSDPGAGFDFTGQQQLPPAL